MRYFVTGHTGFKGSWLTLLLLELGHEVFGFSDTVPRGGLFETARLGRSIANHTIADIRNFDLLQSAIKKAKPDVAIHLAAQALVLPSYENPLATYTTNVDGTLNFLRGVSGKDGPRVSLVVTSDKVYRASGTAEFSEEDSLGGSDPYSASKAMADILTRSWVESGFSDSIYVARAGNVIGAFDVSKYRLMADVWRVLASGETLLVRNPSHIRPWQHVLDCLNGYLLYVEKALVTASLPRALNFGPPAESVRSVLEVVETVGRLVPLRFELARKEGLRETQLLTLNSQLATGVLGWEPKVDFHSAVALSLPSDSTHESASFAQDQVRSFLLG